eukprot:scaffold22233_cov55-Phaeocystis_antarctica.AAC.1
MATSRLSKQMIELEDRPLVLSYTHLDGLHPRQLLLQRFRQLLLLQPAARRNGGCRRRGGRCGRRRSQANGFVEDLSKIGGQRGRIGCSGRRDGWRGGWRSGWRGGWR